MEMYTGAEQRATETYMVPSSALNPHMSYVPQYEEVDYTGSEVAPEYIYDQGLYYPAANYYGYYSGFESPGEWDDQSSFFGVDGPDPLYSGVQTENPPYLYYTPSYGYTQSPYNPYNPYIPGAVIGLDVPYIGTQQYATNPYQAPVSSASYIPVVVQPSTDVLNSTQRPSLLSTGAAGRHVNASVKYTPPLASINVAAKTQRGNPTPETSQASQSRAKVADGLLVNVPSNKQALSQGTASHGSATHATQVRSSSSSVQAQPHFSHGRDSTILNPLKIVGPSNDNFPQYGSNIRGWATVDKFRPRLQFHADLNNPSGVTDALGEHNRGPRTSRSKSQWTPAVDEIDPTKSGSSCTQQSIVISADKYNRDDFPVSYPVAKFFVIKSYSEDDVHKSIKYNVWSSTSNGNRRLDSAYKDAQRISVGHARNCPMFLFFSVNASGQFCGVAEMTGPVEFDKDMDFWQQDKWTGSFPVKWHIIKDVPNTSFRHIILENNENKPVTNSRDTQEIPYFPGLNMLNIFKGTAVKTSILDDFMFYEERERIMQEEKARLLGKSYDASQFVRAVVPVNKSDATIHHPLKSNDKQSNVIVKEPLKANENSPTDANGELPKSDGKTPNGTPRNSTGKPPNGAVEHQPSEADRRSTNVIIRSPPKQNGITDGKTPNHAVDQPTKADGKSSDVFANQSLSKPKDTTTDVRLPKADKNSRKLKDLKSIANEPSTSEQNATQSTADQQVAKPKDITSTDVQLPKADRNLSQLKDLKSITGEPQTSEQKDTQNTSDQRPSKPKDSTRTSVQQPKANRSSKKLKDLKNIADDPSKPEQKDTSDCNQPPKQHGKDGKSASGQHSKAERKQSKPKEQVTQKLDSIILTNDKGDSKQKPTINAGGAKSTTKSGSHAVGSKEDGCSDSGSGAMSTEGSPVSVVTIGSVPIRVKGLVESSSGVITVGTIPIDPKILKHKQGASASSYSNQK